ncbi:hypothetical protein [Phosphitispora fastidiosa]|uniref:hypothetical protein n=1 Tax=Phosphitispora fastidiosa TaxID=2837202 RepID=UPI001E54D8F1|nr:hypothetical protein [Phosphitispora fastidiosa]MBU7007070.1 hypothetical protein [Phosphitispora fastidiosa]
MRAFDIGQVIFKLLHETGRTDAIQLTPGQVISIMVKEVRDGMAVLSYQGKELIARLESEVPPGVNIKCLVEGEKNGRIVLKLLDSSQGNAEFLSKVLRDLGLKVNEANIRLVTEMIRQEMPLTPETVRKLAAFSGSQGIPEGDMRVPVFMQQNGIPLNREMYRFTRELLTDIKFLSEELLQMSVYNQKLAAGTGPGTGSGTQLARLAEALHQVLRSLMLNAADGPETIAAKLADIFSLQAGRSGNSAGSRPGPAELQHLLPQNQPGAGQSSVQQPGTVQLGTVQPGTAQTGAAQSGAAQSGASQSGTLQPGTAQAETVQSGTTQSGTVHTGAIPAGTAQPRTAQSGMPQSAPAQAETTPTGMPQSAAPQGETASSGIMPSATMPSSAAPGGTTQIGKAPNEAAGQGGVPGGLPDSGTATERVYTQILMALREAGNQGQKALITSLAEKISELLSEKGGPEHSEFLQLTKSITDRLDFIRDFNSRVEVNRDNTLLMYSTINFEDKQEPLRLLVNYRYDKKNRKKDFTSCRVEVKLNTLSMGLVRCEIQVAERSLTLGFVTRDEQSCNTIDKLKGILARRLEDMSYAVRMLDSVVDKQEPDLFLQDDTDMSGMFQVNLRV